MNAESGLEGACRGRARHVRVNREIAWEREEPIRLIRRLERIAYACLPDAEAAADRINPAAYPNRP